MVRASTSFADRRTAGRALASALADLPEESIAAGQALPPVVIGLPRGGVPVAFEVALALDAPLDVLVARKIGAPGNPELGIGAVAEGGVRVLSEETMRSLLVSEEELEHGVQRAEQEVQDRVRLYRAGRTPAPLSGRTAIVVDDGLATGGTARAAIHAAYARGAERVVLAVPVGAPSTVEQLRSEADMVICLLEPDPLWAIGLWYRDFSQVPDLEVLGLLARARGRSREAPANRGAPTGAGDGGGAGDSGGGAGGGGAGDGASDCETIEVEIPYEEGASAPGDLTLPRSPRCLVLFAHGSGSSRRSPRNREVASMLNRSGIATLLFDLLTPMEELHRANIFDIALLAARLEHATRWGREQRELRILPFGYFGASTGAAAALWAAAELRDEVGAIVSRGGRPDLAHPRLPEVSAPVLLVVGGADAVVLDLNREALAELRCEAKLEIVPGATHLFEEPGALREVGNLATDWFVRHLAKTAPATG